MSSKPSLEEEFHKDADSELNDEYRKKPIGKIDNLNSQISRQAELTKGLLVKIKGLEEVVQD